MREALRLPVETAGTRLRLLAPHGLLIEATATAADPLVDVFYDEYDRAFTLPNEKERLDGFRDCLALNEGRQYAALSARFGGFREYVIVVTDVASRARVGGANFIAFVLGQDKSNPVLSINLNYIFTGAAFRRRGYFGRLVDEFTSIAYGLFSVTNERDLPATWAADTASRTPTEALVFIEQNDPFLMSRDDYETDTRCTGLDQAERIAIWSRHGAKIVDFDYVQPPLSSEQAPDRTLVYAVLGARGATLDACRLHAHLERFFAISVLKGADPNTEPVAALQLRTLGKLCERNQSVGLLAIPDVRHLANAAGATGAMRPRSLRAALG